MTLVSPTLAKRVEAELAGARGTRVGAKLSVTPS